MEKIKETYACKILTLAALSCETSHLAVKILCNDNLGSCKSTLWRMRQKERHRICAKKDTEPTPLLSAGGKGKGIRLAKAAIPYLKLIDTELFTVYMQRSHQHRGKANAKHSRRLQMVSEVVAVMMQADIELFPSKKRKLIKMCSGASQTQTAAKPMFYISTELKNRDTLREMSYTRCAGLYITPGKPYVVYSTGKGVFEWHENAEERAQVAVERIIRAHFIFNTSQRPIFMADAMLVFGLGIKPAISMLATPSKEWDALHGCYHSVHYAPKNSDGAMLARYMAMPEYLTKTRNFIVPSKDSLIFLDANLVALKKFRRQCESERERRFAIYGTVWELKIAAHYLNGLDNVQFYEVDMEKLLGILSEK